MVRLRVRAAVLILALGFVCRANAQIVNGGFESGDLSGWYQGNIYCSLGPLCTPWSATNAEAHTGTYSAVDEGNIELRQDFIAPIFGGNITSFTYWLMQDVPSISAFYFYYTDATYSESVAYGTSDWQLVDVTSLIDPSKTVLGFSVYGVSGPDPNFTYVDDFSMTTLSAVPEPATMSLLATGLVGLVGAGMRRRKKA